MAILIVAILVLLSLKFHSSSCLLYNKNIVNKHTYIHTGILKTKPKNNNKKLPLTVKIKTLNSRVVVCVVVVLWVPVRVSPLSNKQLYTKVT